MSVEDWGGPSRYDSSAHYSSAQKEVPQKVAEKPAFDSVPEHLRRNSTDANIWKESAAEYARIVKTMTLADRVKQAAENLDEKENRETKCREALQPARDFLGTMPTGNWPSHRSVMVYAALETEDLLLLCEYKILNWQMALDAKAMSGTGADVNAIAAGAKLAGQSLDFSRALSAAALPKLLTQGLFYEGNRSTTDALFDLGALPNYDSTNLFLKVVEGGNMDIARAFAKRAHTVGLNIEKYVSWAQNNNKPKMYEDFRKLQWEYGRYSVTDYETLVETKPLPEKAQLNIIFNFAARRVSEIYDYSTPRQSIKTDIPFEDYAEDAIKAAQKKLIELGGNPTPYDGSVPTKRTIAKPRLTQPQ